MGYVLGVDAGGTKTHYALYDHARRTADLLTGGTGNHEGLPGGFVQLEEELAHRVGALLARNQATYADIDYAVLGMGGVDTLLQHEIISGILRRIGLRDFILCNDAYLGVKAGPFGHGVCAINGTGFSVAGISPDGRMVQIGGFGELSGDFGGGGMLSACAVGRVYDALYRQHSPTALTGLLFDALGVADKREFMERVSQRQAEDGKAFTLTVMHLLLQAASQGDAAASAILTRSGTRYAEAIAAACRELALPAESAVGVVLAGSVFTKAAYPGIQDAMAACLAELMPAASFRYQRLDTPCVTGAVLWALEALGQRADRPHVEASLAELLAKA